MLRISRAGLAAACFQFIAVVMVTTGVLLLAPDDLLPATLGVDPVGGSRSNSGLSLLTWAYLLTAVGVALTSSWSIDSTSAHIRQASRRMRQFQPYQATKFFLAQLLFAVIGLVALTLRPPPELLISAGRQFELGWIFSIGWSGAMSIAIAFFGATARAALKAL